MISLEQRSASDRRKLRSGIAWALAAWTLLMGASLAWWLQQTSREVQALALKEARANFDKDQAFRAWGTLHGGVYVPVDARTPPSPYLDHIPERDLTTPSGRRLTLMNPAYMLRQMMDEFGRLYGVKGRITSLKPLNPNNAPDPWEREALLAFERGEAEALELAAIDGRPYLRLMRPMPTVEGCLKCHAHQGYKVGDVRGGVGVSVPLQPYLAIAAERKRGIWLTHGAIWMVGVAGLGLGGWRGRGRLKERHAFQEQIWRQANFDPLTDLANRSLFMDRLEQAVGQSLRSDRRLALLFIDLDRFKDVNDTRGHDAGDALLQQAAERVYRCVRSSDTVARLGGDEFTVILNDVGRGDAADVTARKILSALSAPFHVDGEPAHVTASIGITVCPDDAEHVGTLLKYADTAMYQAKADGRDTVRFFNPAMDDEARQRVRTESELRRALEREEFELFYQPVFSLPERRLAGAEALLRWRHPAEGLVAPDRFIDVAERSGLILPIGEAVLRTALVQLHTWREAGLLLPKLMVNISTRQCRSPGFIDFVRGLAAEFGPETMRCVTFEVTESMYLGDAETATAVLESFRALGIGIAIDDFGTGYSALAYLKRFPVDTLKIDRDFVRDIADKPGDAALCEAMIAMAHHLGMSVVAEGVETEAQLAILQRQHCDKVQGFLLGRPGPRQALEALLREPAQV